MDIFNYFKIKIIKELKFIADNRQLIFENYPEFTVSLLRNTNLGDITTNIAFIYCKYFKCSAYELAQKFLSLSQNPEIIIVTISKDGFINLKLNYKFWHKFLIRVLLEESSYAKSSQKLNLKNYTFDLNNCDDFSSNNIGFYLPYTYARICSIINNAQKLFNSINLTPPFKEEDLILLNHECDLTIIKTLALWPKIISNAVASKDPNKIISYLQNLAYDFHDSIKKGRVSYDNKYIVENNFMLTQSRCLLAKAIKIVIKNGFLILDIPAIEKI